MGFNTSLLLLLILVAAVFQKEWFAAAFSTTSPINNSPKVNLPNTNNENDYTGGAIDDGETTTDCVVVGAGPAGLLTAIMLAQKFPTKKIKVFDRLKEPPSPFDESIWSDVAKFYLIGLGSRGQKALAHYGVLDDVLNVCTAVVGRKDWSPEAKAGDGDGDGDGGVERIFTDRPVTTQVLPRDKLVGVLHQVVINKYSENIDLNYGYEIVPEDFEANGNSAVKIRVSKCQDEMDRQMPSSSSISTQTSSSNEDGDEPSELCDVDNSFVVTTNFLIAADGTARTVANEMEKSDKARWEALNPVQKLIAQKPFRVRRYTDDNRRLYKTIPMKLPDSWRPDLNYSARTNRINYDALPADNKGNYCGVLLIKETDEFAAPDTDPEKLRSFLDESLPQFSALLDDDTVAEIAKKPPSYLPSFRFAGPRLNQGDMTLILGDCAHTVKPYFGLGANSALEDVRILDDAIESTDSIKSAVELFSKKRAKESRSLVKLSRELDRPGKLGLLTFLIPIIMDGIFHKLLPKVFAPNTISLLQKEGITFTGVRRRKRLDRLGQLALIGVTASGVTWGAKRLLRVIANVATRNPKAGLGFVGLTFAALVIRILKVNPNLSPADVMPKKSK